jgi:hypothetical protein
MNRFYSLGSNVKIEMGLSQTSAATIVRLATNDLIAKADSIVAVCLGPSCNVSPATTLKIKQDLSTLAQSQANLTLRGLGLNQSTVIAFQIKRGYLELGAAVAATYSYQCGASIVSGNSCTFNGSNVVAARHNLEGLLNQAIGVDINRIIVISLMAAAAIIFVALFLIFVIVGSVEFVLEAGLRRNKTVTQIQPLEPVPNITSTPTPQPNMESPPAPSVPTPPPTSIAMDSPPPVLPSDFVPTPASPLSS